MNASNNDVTVHVQYFDRGVMVEIKQRDHVLGRGFDQRVGEYEGDASRAAAQALVALEGKLAAARAIVKNIGSPSYQKAGGK